MENIGKWNSDLVIFYGFIFFLPIVLYFLMGVFIRMVQLSSSINHSVYEPQPIVKYKKTKTQKPKIKVVYVEKNTKNTQDCPIEPIVQITDKTIVDDAIHGLRILGYKKSTATDKINSLCKNKKYLSVEELIKDVMCI